MKKFLSMALAVLMVLSLTACGSFKGKDTAGNSSEQKEASSSEASEPAGSETEEEQKPSGAAATISFDELTVVDNGECVIKITGIDPENMWGYTLNTYLENKSADKTYMYSVESAAINGVQAEPGFAAEVAPGKKANKEISFDDSLADKIGKFTDIELTFKVYDSNDWLADAVAEETVHIYPLGKENASVFSRDAESTDTVLVDNDKVSVIVTGYDPDDFWGYAANLYLVNKTDKELTFSVDNASVNGFMADPFWATSVDGGKVAFSSVSWTDSALEENGIETVDEIEMNFKVHESENWSADDIFNDVITLHP